MHRSIHSVLLFAAATTLARGQWVQGGSFSTVNHFQACAFHQVDTGLFVYGTDNPSSGEGGIIKTWTGMVGSGGYIWYQSFCNIEDIDVKMASNGRPIYLAAGHQQYMMSIALHPYLPGGNPFQFDSVRTGSSRYYRAIRMRSDIVAFAAGGNSAGHGIIDMSTDTGYTWTNIAVLPGQPVSRLHFVNNQLGFAATGGYRRLINNGVLIPDSGAIYRTTNGGMSWQAVYNDAVTGFSDVHFVNTQVGVATRNDGIILRTTNGGDSWSPAVVDWPGPYVMTSVTFRADGTAFASCYRADGSSGFILSSQDEGATWGFNFSTSALNHSRRIYELYFFDDAHGYACTHIRPLRTNGIITNVPDPLTPSFEALYPNPSTDVVTIRLREASSAWIEFIDAAGRVVRTHSSRGPTAVIALEDLLPGSYVVRVLEGTVTWSARMVRL